jgi:hypothetical protein
MCTAYSWFISSDVVHLNSTVMNIGIQVSLLYPDLQYFGYMPRSAITESYDSFIFRFLRNLHTAFHNGCTNLHSYQWCIPISLHPLQHLLMFMFLKIITLIGVRWNLSAVLICIFYGQGCCTLLYVLIGPLYLFLWIFPIQFMCPFLYWVVDSLGLRFFNSLQIWIISSLLDKQTTKIFLPVSRESLRSSYYFFCCADAL